MSVRDFLGPNNNPADFERSELVGKIANSPLQERGCCRPKNIAQRNGTFGGPPPSAVHG